MAGTLCIFGPTCGLGLALEHNGDLYSCDHFVEQSYLLGNITKTPMVELAASAKQLKFGIDKQEKNRFTEEPDGETGLNYLCAGYKAFLATQIVTCR